MQSLQPFAGIKVVEFGQFVAVPYCGQLLADGGADVIKIESPEGDSSRHAAPLVPGITRVFLGRNRGKRSLPLKLRDPGARPVIDALLEWADVVLMNFRPGLATSLGLDGPELRKRYPRLVIGAVTAFGTRGPDAELAGMDVVVQARSGLMAALGRVVDGQPASGEPVPADYMCAMTLAFGVASALYRRSWTGQGAGIDVSLMRAALTLANNQMVRVEDHDGELHRAALRTLNEQRQARTPFQTQLETVNKARHRPLLSVYFRTFVTADGNIAVACGSRALRRRFADLLGFSDAGLDAGEPGGEEWSEHYEALRVQVEAIVATRPSAHWVGLLAEHGIPVAAVKMPIELFDDEQALANDMIVEQEHPEVGTVKLLGPPLAMDGDAFQTAPPMARLGSETRDLLNELGFGDATIDAWVETGITREQNR
ncbi:MAG: CoA transferase [Gammaproteobacteria bacterium]|nr:CoA transferase [Gammaproteobacteria bacterium]